MEKTFDIKGRMASSRGQVYLLWALLVGIGYVATHYYQQQAINAVWLVLSVIGLGYMFRIMPLRIAMMKRIYMAWLVPIGIGMAVSAAVFYVDSLAWLVSYLGAFWLLVQAVGFAWNGFVDRPAAMYYVAAAVNAAGAIICYTWQPLLPYQYLLAAVVSVWSMLMLWVYRAP